MTRDEIQAQRDATVTALTTAKVTASVEYTRCIRDEVDPQIDTALLNAQGQAARLDTHLTFLDHLLLTFETPQVAVKALTAVVSSTRSK